MFKIIFFTKKLNAFKSKKGNYIQGIPCELKTNEKGFYLGKDWQKEIEAKGVKTRVISFDEIMLPEELN